MNKDTRATVSREFVPGIQTQDQNSASNNDNFLDKVCRRIDAAEGDYKVIKDRAEKGRKYHSGKQIDKSEVKYIGEKEIINNRIFIDVETLVALSTSETPEPNITILPQNADNKRLENRLAYYLKDAWENELGMQQILEIVIRTLCTAPSADLKYWFDVINERFVIEFMPPNKLIRPTSASSMVKCPYVVELVEESYDDFCDRFFPDTNDEDQVKLKNSFLALFGEKKPQADDIITYYQYWDNKEMGCIYRDGNKKLELYHDLNPNYNYPEKNEATGKYVQYKNHFKFPQKPYIHINLFSFGDKLDDDATLTELAMTLQDSVNRFKKQVEQNRNAANGRLIGAGKKILRKDFNAVKNKPEEKIYLAAADSVEGALKWDYGRAFDQGLFQDYEDNLHAIDDIFGTHGALRGVRDGQDTATRTISLKQSDQETRVEQISRRVEWLAQEVYNAFIQIMHVYYDKDFPIIYDSAKYFDEEMDDDEASQYMNRMLFQEVDVRCLVKRGSTYPKDKASMEKQAFDLAKAGKMSDVDLYDQLNYPNAKQLARNNYLQLNDPAALYDKQDTDDYEAIAHIKSIIEGKMNGSDPNNVYDQLDLQSYAKHVQTTLDYVRGRLDDNTLIPFDELGENTKIQISDHLDYERDILQNMINEQNQINDAVKRSQLANTILSNLKNVPQPQEQGVANPQAEVQQAQPVQ